MFNNGGMTYAEADAWERAINDNKRIKQLEDVLRELLGCCELNLDEMEQDTCDSIDKAWKVLDKKG